METTDQGTGTLYGVHVNATITYVGTLRPNGTIEGTGTGGKSEGHFTEWK